jgi:hypothetical protein
LAASVSVTRAVSATCSTAALAATATYSTTHRCQCNTGFAGNGFFCGVDSDVDNFPDFTLSGCSGTCGFCRQDTCPLLSSVATASKISITATTGSNVSFPLDPADFQSGTNEWTSIPNGVSSYLTASPFKLDTTAFYSNLAVNGVEFSTNVRVADNRDENSIGVVFGYRHSQSFYLAQFKYVTPNDNPIYWGTTLDGQPRSAGGDLNNMIFRNRGGCTVKR